LPLKKERQKASWDCADEGDIFGLRPLWPRRITGMTAKAHEKKYIYMRFISIIFKPYAQKYGGGEFSN